MAEADWEHKTVICDLRKFRDQEAQRREIQRVLDLEAVDRWQMVTSMRTIEVLMPVLVFKRLKE